ncbi:hypothetical protein DSO57_1022258 [Entomophthora muscae]|uniref:Uncharacterized protein n=1 Tax=Entomophthora muscae TaxID=34485 RepID=A0ACC2RHX3_9FUNG|nr:hypothetical protein DSO57_1022258 [Entomophthora muscae]
MVLELYNWDKWKDMALKQFGNKHIDIIKKLETIQIQDYKTVNRFIDAYRALAQLSICRKLHKGNQNNKSEAEADFNSGIGLTFFKRAIPLEYQMTIEERDIEDLIDAYSLVKKFFRIKVENLPDEKAKKASPWNPFSKKVNKEPKPADLLDKLTKVLEPSWQLGSQSLITTMVFALTVSHQNIKLKTFPRNVNTARRTIPAKTANSLKNDPEKPSWLTFSWQREWSIPLTVLHKRISV